MSRIEAICPTCGPVICVPSDFDLRIWTGNSIWYAFMCPRCNEQIEKPADVRALNILLGEGLRPHVVRPAPAVHEPLDAPPITLDDVLTFHELLQGTDWFRHLTRR